MIFPKNTPLLIIMHGRVHFKMPLFKGAISFTKKCKKMLMPKKKMKPLIMLSKLFWFQVKVFKVSAQLLTCRGLFSNKFNFGEWFSHQNEYCEPHENWKFKFQNHWLCCYKCEIAFNRLKESNLYWKTLFKVLVIFHLLHDMSLEITNTFSFSLNDAWGNWLFMLVRT